MTPRLTSDARRALGAAGLARRRFLQQSSALVVAFGAARYAGPDSRLSAQGINGRSSAALDAWIAIAADGRVVAYTGKCELGQGLYTAQVQLVAEELDVPLSRVTLTMCDTAVTPDQGTTSGAQSRSPARPRARRSSGWRRIGSRHRSPAWPRATVRCS